MKDIVALILVLTVAAFVVMNAPIWTNFFPDAPSISDDEVKEWGVILGMIIAGLVNFMGRKD